MDDEAEVLEHAREVLENRSRSYVGAARRLAAYVLRMTAPRLAGHLWGCTSNPCRCNPEEVTYVEHVEALLEACRARKAIDPEDRAALREADERVVRACAAMQEHLRPVGGTDA